MNKKIIIALMFCALPFFAMAQLKIGHVNTANIVEAMPERVTIEKTLKDLESKWETILQKLGEEYTKKGNDYKKDASTMSTGQRDAAEDELRDLEKRIDAQRNIAIGELQSEQQKLMQPVIEKIRKAIEQVGAENSYTYIIDESTQVFLYIAPTANNITDLVKQKLGIK